MCPYYDQKQRIKTADIIFMPYNYIIDQQIRERIDIDLKRCIVIIDEGHNISAVAEQSQSFTMTQGKDFILAYNNLKDL